VAVVRRLPDAEAFSLAAACLAVREEARLGDAPGATNAWLGADTDKTVRQLADKVRAAD
jgi:hypothetical protein